MTPQNNDLFEGTAAVAFVIALVCAALIIAAHPVLGMIVLISLLVLLFLRAI